MKFILSLSLLMFCSFNNYAQHRLTIAISHTENKTPLNGATAQISSLNRSAVADSNGIILFEDLPQGTYSITLSYAGLMEQTITANVPQDANVPLAVTLSVGEEEEEE